MEARQGRLSVRLNGRTALAMPVPYFLSDPDTVAIGSNPNGAPVAAGTFTGAFLSFARLAAPPPSPGFGAVRLRVLLPSFTGVRSEPLVCAGAPGRGDLVYLRYEGPDRISFGYDHWSAGGPSSPICRVNFSVPQEIEVDFGALHPASSGAEPKSGFPGRVGVRLDGRTVLDQPVPSYACDPASIAIGVNPIRASTASASFTGELIESSRLGGGSPGRP